MNNETYRAWLAGRINIQLFEGYWNDRRNGGLGTRGRETWIHGQTGLSDITISTEGEGTDQHFVARISIPVTSHYKRKTFIGVGSEYREEGWTTTYRYTVTYRRGFIMNRFENETFFEHSTAADHDAVQWSQQELRNDVFSRLTAG